jgi:hypothetical protein
MKRNDKSQIRIDRRADLDRKAQPAKARDELKAAFSGDENRGPSKRPKAKNEHGTKTRSRKLSRRLPADTSPTI